MVNRGRFLGNLIQLSYIALTLGTIVIHKKHILITFYGYTIHALWVSIPKKKVAIHKLYKSSS